MALELLAASGAADRQRFAREASALAELRHPAIHGMRLRQASPRALRSSAPVREICDRRETPRPKGPYPLARADARNPSGHRCRA